MGFQVGGQYRCITFDEESCCIIQYCLIAHYIISSIYHNATHIIGFTHS